MDRLLLAVLAASAAIIAGPAAQAQGQVQAQTQGANELTLFSRGRFTGSRLTFSGPMRSMEIFPVRSVLVPEGTAWDLCTGNNFTGCRRVEKSRPATIMSVRSIRPAALAVREAAVAAAASSIGTSAGLSMRGMASEFFIAPEEGGSRVEIGPGASAAERASAFCRARGWGTAAHQDVQAAGGRSYLADVLCTTAR